MSEEKTVMITFRITSDLIERLDKIVKREQTKSLGTVTRSSVARAAMLKGLNSLAESDTSE